MGTALPSTTIVYAILASECFASDPASLAPSLCTARLAISFHYTKKCSFLKGLRLYSSYEPLRLHFDPAFDLHRQSDLLRGGPHAGI